MKKIALSVVVMSAIAMAGGDIAPVEPMVDTPVSPTARNFYVGMGIAGLSTRDAAVSMDIFNVKNGQDRLGNVTFLAGYNFNRYLSLEGRYTTTFSQEDLVEMDGWSIFAKPQYPITENFDIYALLGFGNVTLSPVGNLPVSVDNNGFQWGVGIDYKIMYNVTLFFDYTSLANDTDGIYWNGGTKIDTDAFTFGATYSF